MTEDVLGFKGGCAQWSSSIGKQVAHSEPIRFKGSAFAPEVHYLSCAGTHMSVSYAFGSHGMCTFYPSGCQSTGSLSVAIARSEGGEVLIGQSQCITVKKQTLSVSAAYLLPL